MAKEIDVTSLRQTILEVLYNAGKAMKGSEIRKVLIDEFNVDKKVADRVHGYLVSFRSMATPKVTKDGPLYKLTQAAIEQFEVARGLREEEPELATA